VLGLRETQVTDAGEKALQKALPNCMVVRNAFVSGKAVPKSK
jgi:hypothetical protein